MSELGSAERWPARLCERKWDEIRQNFPSVDPGAPDETNNLHHTMSSPKNVESLMNRSSHTITPIQSSPIWGLPEPVSGGISNLSGQSTIDYTRLEQRQS